MNVLIFGPSGRVGNAAVKIAIKRGWKVTAFARNPHKISSPLSTSLTVVKGNVIDIDSVKSVMPGHDAVLVCLGGRGIMNPDDICSLGRHIFIHTWSEKSIIDVFNAEGTRVIIAAMKSCCPIVPRLVIISTMGASESAEHVPGFVRWFLK